MTGLVILFKLVGLDGTTAAGIRTHLTVPAGIVIAVGGWMARSADDGGP